MKEAKKHWRQKTQMIQRNKRRQSRKEGKEGKVVMGEIGDKIVVGEIGDKEGNGGKEGKKS